MDKNHNYFRPLAGIEVCLLSALSSQAAVLLPNGSPNSADAGIVLWLDSSNAGSLWQDTAGTIAAAAGQPVARWDSRTLNGISVQQPSAGNTPSLSTGVAALNGVNTVSFAGGSGGDALTSTTGNSTGVNGAAANLTMVTVWVTTGFTGQNYQHSIQIGNTVGGDSYGHSVSRGGNAGEVGNHYCGSGFNSTATVGIGSASLAVSTYDGVTDTWFVNGAAALSNAVGLNIATTQLQIGSRLNPFVEGFTGELAEVIMFDSVLSGNDRNLLGGYIQNRYGFTVEDAIPKPSSGMLALFGFTGLMMIRRRRKS